MPTVRVVVYVHASPEEVFDLVSDHGGFARWPGISGSGLLRQGDDERDGVGAVREILAGGACFHEDVTAFERPRLYEYRIRRLTLGPVPVPIEHRLGRVELIPRGEGTEVVWTSVFEIRLPLAGGLLGQAARKSAVDAFTGILLAIKERLEGAGGEAGVWAA